MQKSSITLAISLMLAGTSAGALAQSATQSNFVGPAIGISVSSVQNKVDYESTTPSINGQSTQNNDSDVSLLGSWGFAVSPDWVTTLGVSYSFKSVDMGTVNYTGGGAQNFTVKGKEHLSLSVAPGYRIGPNALVYGKLAYHQIKGEFTDTFSGTGTTNNTGSGVGLGVAFALDRQVELRAEYETVTYSGEKANTTTGKFKPSGLNIGLLYKF